MRRPCIAKVRCATVQLVKGCAPVVGGSLIGLLGELERLGGPGDLTFAVARRAGSGISGGGGGRCGRLAGLSLPEE